MCPFLDVTQLPVRFSEAPTSPQWFISLQVMTSGGVGLLFFCSFASAIYTLFCFFHLFCVEQTYASLTNAVYGLIGGVPIPFPLTQASVCELGATCPVEVGTDYVETVVIDVLSSYPCVSITFPVCSHSYFYLCIFRCCFPAPASAYRRMET